MSSTASAPAATTALARRPAAPRTDRAGLLGWAFTLFSSLRIVAYLPTLLAIQASGGSEQHSLWTWLVFLGSNATRALWLREQHGGVTRAVTVCAANALMCAAICALIVWTRWAPAIEAWLAA